MAGVLALMGRHSHSAQAPCKSLPRLLAALDPRVPLPSNAEDEGSRTKSKSSSAEAVIEGEAPHSRTADSSSGPGRSGIPAVLSPPPQRPGSASSSSLSPPASFPALGSIHHQPWRTDGAVRYAQTAARASTPDMDISMADIASKLFDGEERSLLTPAAIVGRLDQYIVGQEDAKRAVAVALRNRWRRARLPKLAADEILPKNILLVGPTGCGKTEIARRLAKLADAPFIKVEATKYTELGYVGRDVEDIIKDLVEAAQALVRTRLREKVMSATKEKAETIILTALCGEHVDEGTLESFRGLYRNGVLDNSSVEVEVPPSKDSQSKNPSMDKGFIMIDQLMRSQDKSSGKKGEKRKMKVSEAKARLEEGETERLLSTELVAKEAIRAAEQDGIVFIDEIDKIVEGSGRSIGGGVSSEGVQRDLLPIIEGSTVNTKHGNVNTDHILFICSGAFHSSKPSDMLAELQGRLPIKVSLKGLTADDFYHILTVPTNNMIKQQTALLETEGVALEFTEAAVRRIATLAAEANQLLDNIGARRLHTVLERILSEVSFSAPDLVEAARKEGKDGVLPYIVEVDHVNKVMVDLLKSKDLSRYVL